MTQETDDFLDSLGISLSHAKKGQLPPALANYLKKKDAAAPGDVKVTNDGKPKKGVAPSFGKKPANSSDPDNDGDDDSSDSTDTDNDVKPGMKINKPPAKKMTTKS